MPKLAIGSYDEEMHWPAASWYRSTFTTWVGQVWSLGMFRTRPPSRFWSQLSVIIHWKSSLHSDGFKLAHSASFEASRYLLAIMNQVGPFWSWFAFETLISTYHTLTLHITFTILHVGSVTLEAMPSLWIKIAFSDSIKSFDHLWENT